MSPGGAIIATIVLVLVAGATAGFWLNILMWIPMLLIGWLVRDEETAFGIVSLLAMTMAIAAVLVFGLLVIALPWYAAVIAALLVGITSYARPNPGHPDSFAQWE